MSTVVMIDYGCHLFSYKLAVRLYEDGRPIRYFANGSLESPNQRSVQDWARQYPALVRSVACASEYGKMSLHKRLIGEYRWAGRCIEALEQERPSAIVLSCVPLVAVTRIQAWARRRGVQIVYWLQDLQGRAVHDLLGRHFGLLGRAAGSLADIWEQEILEESRMVITIAREHERSLPFTVRMERRYALLENWADIETIPLLDRDNEWAQRHGLDRTSNVIYSGTLGMKHDLRMFTALAASLKNMPDARVVIVSSGEAPNHLAKEAQAQGLDNLLVFPFQPYEDVPKVLASATVLIAPLDPSAGSFCIPSKILSYLCAGRPTVIAIGDRNPAARMISDNDAGSVVRPGDTEGFIAAVTELLANPFSAQRQGRSARAFAEDTFRLDRVTERFLGILESADLRMARPGVSAPAEAYGTAS